MSPSPESLGLANEVAEHMAQNRLSPSVAKLYSQFTKLNADGIGINWNPREASYRLDDAVILIQIGLLQKEAGNEAFRNSLRRAAELLEWLDHPVLNPSKVPIPLLCAALYQLAGYPARSHGVIRSVSDENSSILNNLLKGNFPILFYEISKFWGQQNSVEMPNPQENSSKWVQSYLVKETVTAIGVLCSEIRWGEEARTSKAIEKLEALSALLLDSTDVFGWLLSKLFAEVAKVYSEKSLRALLSAQRAALNSDGQLALERYLRQSYLHNKSIAWASQEKGIQLISQDSSFALCTPTGSGKTTVAELAIIKNLFSASHDSPLIVYLVPSRALANEVETKLARILRRISDGNIVVTGLYGGNDWGPTDTWLTVQKPTVLICTYEKIDALLRLLGTVFLQRVSLLVIDEAHNIQLTESLSSLQDFSSRSLRFESLAMRLFTHLGDRTCQKIALSAVVDGADNSLGDWVAGERGTAPVRTTYRSTRQLIGRLEITDTGGYEIRYDLMDGHELKFTENNVDDGPYIPNPFPPAPPAEEWDGPDTKMRPHVLWAAMQLAASANEGAVLISITQGIENYIKDFWDLLSDVWRDVEKPAYFTEPTNESAQRTWVRCKECCADYFGMESLEYKLLTKGIIIHHSKMPGLMSRCLVEAVQAGIASIVVATSTLSEGVNLPFRTILVPSLFRGQRRASTQELKNLIGRAGRPGNGTEGRTLVLMPENQYSRNRIGYAQFVEEVLHGASETSASPLNKLIELLREKWQLISQNNSEEAFLSWLETTAPIEDSHYDEQECVRTLDALDGVLLAAISEIDSLDTSDVSSLEEKLQSFWRNTYSHFSQVFNDSFGEVFVKRGVALVTQIYPDNAQRRRLYKTNLTPRNANTLLALYPGILTTIQTGEGYTSWDSTAKLRFIEDIAEKIGEIPKFTYDSIVRRRAIDWRTRLRWWLNPTAALESPTPEKISSWHDYTRKNFLNRFNWGYGSVIGLVFESYYQETNTTPSLEEWTHTGLPWVAYWIKELINWGTLDPVAAYLLSMGIKHTRRDAEALARSYYENTLTDDPNEILNAATIKGWASQFTAPIENLPSAPPTNIDCELQNQGGQLNQKWRVLPVDKEDHLLWIDVGGFVLAKSARPARWDSDFGVMYDFILDIANNQVISNYYLNPRATEEAEQELEF